MRMFVVALLPWQRLADPALVVIRAASAASLASPASLAPSLARPVVSGAAPLHFAYIRPVPPGHGLGCGGGHGRVGWTSSQDGQCVRRGLATRHSRLSHAVGCLAKILHESQRMYRVAVVGWLPLEKNPGAGMKARPPTWRCFIRRVHCTRGMAYGFDIGFLPFYFCLFSFAPLCSVVIETPCRERISMDRQKSTNGQAD